MCRENNREGGNGGKKEKEREEIEKGRIRERERGEGGEGANGDEKGCVRKYGENGRGVKEGQGVTTLKAHDGKKSYHER